MFTSAHLNYVREIWICSADDGGNRSITSMQKFAAEEIQCMTSDDLFDGQELTKVMSEEGLKRTRRRG